MSKTDTPNTWVIYHSKDNDGHCCRAIAERYLPGAHFVGLDYGEPVPAVPADATLYILDLSVPELMTHPKLIWIDHHKSAIETYPTTIPGYRIDGVAACRLAWQWFAELARNFYLGEWPSQKDGNLPDKEAYVQNSVREPLAVRLIGQNDVWDHRDPRAALFQAGLDGLETVPWPELLADHEARNPRVEFVLGIAPYIAQARKNGVRRLLDEGAFTLEWEGLRWLSINAGGLSSHAYEQAGRDDVDAGLSFHLSAKAGRWKVSMRALRAGLDLTPIAQKYGGGGHRAACGFSCDRLPFTAKP